MYEAVCHSHCADSWIGGGMDPMSWINGGKQLCVIDIVCHCTYERDKRRDEAVCHCAYEQDKRKDEAVCHCTYEQDKRRDEAVRHCAYELDKRRFETVCHCAYEYDLHKRRGEAVSLALRNGRHYKFMKKTK